MITGLQEARNPFTNARLIGAGIDPEVYHRQDPKTPRGHPQFVMSRSELMLFASCPSRWINGYAPKETDATEWGSLLDALITGTAAEFDARYVVHPTTVTATKTMACVRNGEVEAGAEVLWRACGEATKWKRENSKGRQVISPDLFQEVEQARARLAKDPDLGRFIAGSAKQVMVTAEYCDRETGLVIPWKTLIDFVPTERDEVYRNYLGDLKSCKSADPSGWDKECDRRHYDAQAAANLDAYKVATGEPRCDFAHILVENTFPFEPSGAVLSYDLVELGRLKIIGALRWYCQCLKLNHWPTWREFSVRNLKNGFLQIDAGEWHSQLKPR